MRFPFSGQPAAQVHAPALDAGARAAPEPTRANPAIGLDTSPRVCSGPGVFAAFRDLDRDLVRAGWHSSEPWFDVVAEGLEGRVGVVRGGRRASKTSQRTIPGLDARG
jgi:hypothetical protein